MAIATRSTLIAATALLHFVSFASSQGRNASESSCNSDTIAEGQYNSSGTRAFAISGLDPWAFTVILQDRRPVQDDVVYDPPTQQRLSTFLSVPKSLAGTDAGNTTRVCAYWMAGQNATSSASDANNATQSCDGVLEDKCQQALRNIKRPSPTDEECPKPGKDINDACPDGLTYTSRPSNFSSLACTYKNMSGIDLPTDYVTYPWHLGLGFKDTDPAINSFDYYDLRVRQSIPVVITTYLAEIRLRSGVIYQGTQLFCLAPSNVTAGSRDNAVLPWDEGSAQSGEEDSSSGASNGRNHEMMLTIIAFFIVMLLLV